MDLFYWTWTYPKDHDLEVKFEPLVDQILSIKEEDPEADPSELEEEIGQ